MCGNSSCPFIQILCCDFKDIVKDSALFPIDNKSTLCMVEDFEDGKWRYEHFLNYIWDSVAETALNEKERRALCNRPRTLLKEAASKLRLTKGDGEGGEIAEILLYAIMRDFYKAFPVVPKIFYKQNRRDYAKGADSVHIVVSEEENAFSLWLGEAKFYNSLKAQRLDTIVSSVFQTLNTEKIKKENSLILGLGDLECLKTTEEIKQKIKRVLNKDTSIDQLKPYLHIPIFILHECEITKNASSADETYKDLLKKLYIETANSYFTKQLEKCGAIFNYEKITFHLIMIPVPNKEEIVKSFVEEAKGYCNGK